MRVLSTMLSKTIHVQILDLPDDTVFKFYKKGGLAGTYSREQQKWLEKQIKLTAKQKTSAETFVQNH